MAPEPSQARARPSAEAMTAKRPRRSERPAFPGDLAIPDDFATQVMAAQPLGSTRQADPGDAGGRALWCLDQEGRIGGVERETDGGLSGGVEDLKLAAVGGDCREPLGADGQVFDGEPQLVLPDPTSGGGEPADAVAFLDQGETEVVGLDGQVGELHQADVEPRERVSPEVAKTI